MAVQLDRYLPIYGFNTKQWWAYDEHEDVYIDPPKYVLDYINEAANDLELMGIGIPISDIECVLMAKEIVDAQVKKGDRSWLNDKEFWYKEIE